MSRGHPLLDAVSSAAAGRTRRATLDVAPPVRGRSWHTAADARADVPGPTPEAVSGGDGARRRRILVVAWFVVALAVGSGWFVAPDDGTDAVVHGRRRHRPPRQPRRPRSAHRPRPRSLRSPELIVPPTTRRGHRGHAHPGRARAPRPTTATRPGFASSAGSSSSRTASSATTTTGSRRRSPRSRTTTSRGCKRNLDASAALSRLTPAQTAAARLDDPRAAAGRDHARRTTRRPSRRRASRGPTSPRSTSSRPAWAASTATAPPARRARCSSSRARGRRTATAATSTTTATRSSPPGRYLKAAGGPANMDKAIFAYNHDDGYVAAVKAYAAEHARRPACVRRLLPVAGLLPHRRRHGPAPRGLHARAAPSVPRTLPPA